ncbi:MAG: hypothetical protein GEU83_06180 [Pseudonocardiaceae bacterium]|nr:hypothetical protein [Pseudonocardiaceae bacterium]
MGRAPYRPDRRSRGPLRFVGLLLLPFLIVAAVLVAGGVVAGVAIFAMLVRLAPLVLLALCVVAVAAFRRGYRAAPARSRRRAAVTPPAPKEAPTPDSDATRARFGRLQQEYARFECDPLAVLRTPALADVSVAATGRFVEAFAEAQALDSDIEPSAAHRASFAAAVDRAWRAWYAATDAAERIRLANIPPAERATVERAIKLLSVGRESSSDAERAAAYARARAELAKLERSGTLRLPHAAAAALQRASRGQLPPSG